MKSIIKFSGVCATFSQTGIALLFIAANLACNKDKNKQSDDYTVITLAGSSDGFADGFGRSAKFRSPRGIAADIQGNIYVADNGNNRIRKITASGDVSTLAGNGTFGYTDGSGDTVQIGAPNDVAADAQGNVYVTEEFRIRKISPAGNVSTLVGGNSPGFADGHIDSAKFSALTGIVIDGQGNIYVADNGNQRIRKITNSGMVSTLAGNGTVGLVDGNGTAAQFNGPGGLAIDVHGNVIVADLTNRCIRKITPGGVVSTLASLGEAGALFGWAPTGVAVDAQGNIFVSCGSSCSIRQVTPAGDVGIIAGSTCGYADGSGNVAKFWGSAGIATDAHGNVYVTDYLGNTIRKISKK